MLWVIDWKKQENQGPDHIEVNKIPLRPKLFAGYLKQDVGVGYGHSAQPRCSARATVLSYSYFSYSEIVK